MFPSYEPPTFKGDYFNVGFQHAKWWISYLLQPGCEDYNKYYRSFLRRSWKSRFTPLLENTTTAFPQIIEEIRGIYEALKDGGFHTTFEDTFAVCLGETGDKGSQCTSFVAIYDEAIYLGHNEEEDGICPLCIAKVEIQSNNDHKEFVAASYPFQLFGSAFGGMNRNIAFQGNSIGYHRQPIEATWSERIPKTVFTRIFLEANNLKEILTLCAEWLFSLPSHHYVVDKNSIYSLEVRPSSIFKYYPLYQVELHELQDSIHCHTNHFLKDSSVDKDWQWKHIADREETVKRLMLAQRLTRKIAKHDIANCKILKEIASNKLCAWKTSASFQVKRDNKHIYLDVFCYFNNMHYRFYYDNCAISS